MTTVLITGAGGQLGRELTRAAWGPRTDVVALSRENLDITDATAVRRAIDAAGPCVIVNAAAYTAVDQAESEPEVAHAVNVAAVEHLTEAARNVGGRLIHLSTDYVFDGQMNGWYVETDPVAPMGVYGRTKALGEDAARSLDRHLILRTAWVYGALGPNFVHTMRRLAGTHTELSVVADQVGCPTATADLATAIVELAHQPIADELTGTYHLASPESATWHEFAFSILADHIDRGLQVHAITTADYPTPAQRPANSRLDSSAIATACGIRLPSWRESLPLVLAEIEPHRTERRSS